MTRKLQITLYVIAAYFGVFGILFLFAPGVAERITQTPQLDASLKLLFGQYTLTFALVAFMAAREREAATRLSLTILLLTAGHVLVFGYLLIAGIRGLAEAGPPLVVNLGLTILLLLFRR